MNHIYALGVLLYELLTGKTPIQGERLRTVAFGEMQRIIREEEPPKPSVRLSTLGNEATIIAKQRNTDPVRLRREIRGELDWIVMKALEKDRSRRYETAAGFAADLDRFLCQQPVEAGPPSPWYRVRKFVRRNRLAVAAASAICLALIAGTLLASIGLAVAVGTAHDLKIQKDEKEQALAKETETRRQLELQTYEYGINLAYEALNRGNRNEFERILGQLQSPSLVGERRGFEWRLACAQQQELLASDIIRTSDQPVSLSYHPSGDYLAIGCEDATVMVVDCHSGDQRSPPNGMAGGHVVFSPKGNYLAVSGTGNREEDDTVISLWRFPTFQQVTWDKAVTLELSSVTVSPDETLLAGVRRDGVIELRAVETGNIVSECHGHSEGPVHIVFSTDGQSLVSACHADSTLRFWNLDGEELDQKPQASTVLALAISSDGSTVVSNGGLGAKRWKITQEGLEELDSMNEGLVVYSLAFSPDDLLAVGCADQTVRIWDMEKTLEMQRLLHTTLVTAVAFSPDKRTLAVATRDNMVHLWDRQSWAGEPVAHGSIHPFPPLAVNTHGTVLTAEVRDDKRMLKMWCPQDGTDVELWSHPEGQIVGVAFSPNAALIGYASYDGTVRLGEATSGKLLAERKAHAEMATCVAFSPDGRTFVSGGNHSELFFWDLPSWAESWQTYEPQKFVGPGLSASFAFSPTGYLAIGGGQNWNHRGSLMLWDLSGGIPRRIRQEPCPETVQCVAFSPDGKRLAITYRFSAGVVRVLDTSTFETVFEFQGHANKVTTLAFTHDGTRLITGSDDGTIRFWDLSNGTPVGTLAVGARVRNLALLPDQKTLVACCLDGWVRQWRALP